MRRELNKINMEGTVVIGEGEMDEAPMLYIGEKLGTLNGPKFDIAVDPLEGTKFTANGEDNAFSVLAISEKGCLLSALIHTWKKLLSVQICQKILSILIMV